MFNKGSKQNSCYLKLLIRILRKELIFFKQI
uniref:Uncharacterized protein n=1 Tax=Arundo donax TaxID=35708 RepID=A0A0A8ZEN4_ARUDO